MESADTGEKINKFETHAESLLQITDNSLHPSRGNFVSTHLGGVIGWIWP
jgi:hypothetical protein